MIDLHRPHIQPVFDELNAIVYSARSSDVVLTMCDGRVLYRDGVYLTLGDEGIIAGCARSSGEILEKL